MRRKIFYHLTAVMFQDATLSKSDFWFILFLRKDIQPGYSSFLRPELSKKTW